MQNNNQPPQNNTFYNQNIPNPHGNENIPPPSNDQFFPQNQNQEMHNPDQPKKKKGFFSKAWGGMKKGVSMAGKGVKKGVSLAGKGVQKAVVAGGNSTGGKMITGGILQVVGPNTFKQLNHQLKNLKGEIKNLKIVKGAKHKMNKYIKVKIEKLLVNYLKKVPPLLKKEIKDPDMCNCVKNFIDDSVDNFWPDIEEQILFQFRLKLNKPVLQEPKKPEYSALCCLCLNFRACFRYNYDPVDKTIWKQLKNFWFWLIMLIEMFPFYAVQPLFKFLIWILIDKTDEFQLVKFILDFKTLQFFTLGCIGSILGYTSYYGCISFYSDGRDQKGLEINSCAAKGPRDTLIYFLEIAGFALQILLIWCSYILMKCSKVKGIPKFTYRSKQMKMIERESKQGCCKTRGGRLGYFMCFELVNTIVSIGLCLLLVFQLDQSDNISFRGTIFFCKTVYGLLSFPFILFAIPVLPRFLTKSKGTKYDKYGNCVPDLPSVYEYQKKLKKKEEEKKMKKMQKKMNKSSGNSDDEDLDDLINGNIELFDEEKTVANASGMGYIENEQVGGFSTYNNQDGFEYN